MSNPIRKNIKTADIVAGAIAVLLAVPNLNLAASFNATHIILIVLIFVALIAGWFMGRGKYWMLKIFLSAGVMLFFMLIARIGFSIFENLAY